MALVVRVVNVCKSYLLSRSPASGPPWWILPSASGGLADVS